MVEGIQPNAQLTYWMVQGRALFLLLHILGIALSPTSSPDDCSR
jgi:hypothetical protein